MPKKSLNKLTDFNSTKQRLLSLKASSQIADMLYRPFSLRWRESRCSRKATAAQTATQEAKHLQGIPTPK